MAGVPDCDGSPQSIPNPNKGILKLKVKCVPSPVNGEKFIVIRDCSVNLRQTPVKAIDGDVFKETISPRNLHVSPSKYSPAKKPRLTNSPNVLQKPMIVDILEDSSPSRSLNKRFYKNPSENVASVARKLLMTPDKAAPVDKLSPKKTVSLREVRSPASNNMTKSVSMASDSNPKRRKTSKKRIISFSSSDSDDVCESEVEVEKERPEKPSRLRSKLQSGISNDNVRVTRSATKREQDKKVKDDHPTKPMPAKTPTSCQKPTSICYNFEISDLSDEEWREDFSSSDSDSDFPRKPNLKSAKKSTDRKVEVTPKSRTKSVCTPKIPARKKTNSTPLNELRENLHVSSVPDTLPCREKEFNDIYSFVKGKIKGGVGGCMYISGVPGTGKTATVNEVIRMLQDAVKSGKLTDFKFVGINGMELSDPNQAYVQIIYELKGEKTTKDHATKILDEMFSKPSSKREMVILMVDELDLLWTRKQDVLYKLFDLTTRPKSRLVVLAIANTMDLPERMMNKVSSRLGLTRITFQPYNFTQLQEIIRSRIGSAMSFHADAVQLISRKVAAGSGDARRALQISRRATEIAESIGKSPLKGGLFAVGIDEVKTAIEEMFTSTKALAIRNASSQEKLFLRAVVGEMTRCGVEEAIFHRVAQEHISLCRQEGYEPPNSSVIARIVARLSSCGLVLVENDKSKVNARVRLSVALDDVNYALQP